MLGGGSLAQAMGEAVREKRREKALQDKRNEKEATINDIKDARARVVEKLDENAADIHATMVKQLPKQVIIQTSQKDNRYLHFYKEHPVLPNALRFVGDYSFELETRFEVEPATKGTGLIHLRCLRNNKYWANFGTASNWVSAMADKPEENQSDKHCTLFQPIFVHSNNNRVLRLRHVNTGLFVTFFHGSGDYFALLSLLPGEDRGYDVCTFIDWESVVVLPHLIRIKGHNGKHLQPRSDGFMQCVTEADNSSSFDYEVYPSRDGGIRLKSVRNDKYWSDMGTHDLWITLKQLASTTVHEPDTVFLPTVVDGNRIVMRNLDTGMVCTIFTAAGLDYVLESCLATRYTYPDEGSFMEIEEPFISRKIDNVRYHLTDARRYNERTFALITDDSSNRTEKGTLTCQANLKTTVTNTYTWNTGDTLKLGRKMSFTAGKPEASSFGFEVSAEVTGSYSWGDTKTETEEIGSVVTITVPPKGRTKSSYMATRLSYDVPFSYTQRDVLKDGTAPKVTEKHDGLFTSHNGYNYRFKDEPLPLEPPPSKPLPIYK